MADESSFESSNDHSQSNEWETGVTGELEAEWRQLTAAYASPESLPEWESSAIIAPYSALALPILHRERLIPKVRSLITHCRKIALPVTIETLGEVPGEFPNFSSPGQRIQKLLAEYETVLNTSEHETVSLETETLGESEFNAELAASDQAQDLALTEVLATEATHAETENEAQSLLATALPINMSLLNAGASLKHILPTLTQTNARLVSALFRSGRVSREALGLLPAIQRRAISSMMAARNNQQKITPDIANKIFTAQTAKVLTSPSIIGRALVRNQAIRSNTMPACPQMP